MKHARLRAVATCACLLAAAGCDRKPRLVPASADSTAVGQDSVAVLARQASQQWEGGQPEQAAAVSARVVRARLAGESPTSSWGDRARSLLDSLGFAAEVSGNGGAVVVNLFSRADAEGVSWPYFFWSEPDGVRLQSLEGRGMRLLDAATRGLVDGVAGDSAQLAVLWGRRSGSGQQPLLLTWRHARGGRWDLAQTLGPDSLGGTGNGQFEDRDLITKTFRPTPYFDECPSCPHVYHERRFTWGPQGFARVDDRVVPSPYATFTAFVGALVAGDRDEAAQQVADPSLVEFARSRQYEWNDPSLGRWRPAPGTEANAPEMTFFRGRTDAFHVTFQPRGARWVVLGFESTTRSVE